MVNGSVLGLLRKPVALEEKVELPLYSPTLPSALPKDKGDTVFWHQACLLSSMLPT